MGLEIQGAVNSMMNSANAIQAENSRVNTQALKVVASAVKGYATGGVAGAIGGAAKQVASEAVGSEAGQVAGGAAQGVASGEGAMAGIKNAVTDPSEVRAEERHQMAQEAHASKMKSDKLRQKNMRLKNRKLSAEMARERAAESMQNAINERRGGM